MPKIPQLLIIDIGIPAAHKVKGYIKESLDLFDSDAGVMIRIGIYRIEM